MEAAGIDGELERLDVPEEAGRAFVFRPVHRNGSTVAARGMSEAAAINNPVQRACVRALGPDGRAYSAHSLRAGFATYASQRGASDWAIAHQTPTGRWRRWISTSASKAPGPTTRRRRLICDQCGPGHRSLAAVTSTHA
jgi:integrase